MHKQNKVPTCVLSVHLAQALRDAQLDTATRLSSHFDRLIAHISKLELNRTEIIELLG